MLRPLTAALLFFSLCAAACGSGGRAAPASISSAVHTSVASATVDPARSTPTITASPTASSGQVSGTGVTFGELFSAVVNGAFLGIGLEAPPALDATLERFLPGDEDLPEGFTKFVRTYRLTEEFTGGLEADMASAMATDADFDDLPIDEEAPTTLLMLVVAKPDDPATTDALEQAAALDESSFLRQLDEVADAFGAAGIDVSGVEILEADGLGESGIGLRLSGAGTDELGSREIDLRIYLFARRGYVGAVIHIASPTSKGVDELGLAKAIDAKLQSG